MRQFFGNCLGLWGYLTNYIGEQYQEDQEQVVMFWYLFQGKQPLNCCPCKPSSIGKGSPRHMGLADILKTQKLPLKTQRVTAWRLALSISRSINHLQRGKNSKKLPPGCSTKKVAWMLTTRPRSRMLLGNSLFPTYRVKRAGKV